MCIKFVVNRIKIYRFISLRSGPRFGARKSAKNGTKNGAEKFPTDCYREINRYKWRPSGFMTKINVVLYRSLASLATKKNQDTVFGRASNSLQKICLDYFF